MIISLSQFEISIDCSFAAVPPDMRKGCASFPPMKISNDNPFYYLTSVTNNRLPVLRTDKLKEITANAINEARKSAGIFIYAYVLMPDHYHLMTDSRIKSGEVLRFINGITARRVINYLKENNFTTSLEKLRQETKKRE